MLTELIIFQIMSSKSLKIFGITFLVVILLYKLRIEGHEAYTEEKHADKPTQPMKIRQNEETYGKSRKNNDEHHEKHNAIERDPERIKVVQDKEKNFTYPTDFRKKTRTKFR